MDFIPKITPQEARHIQARVISSHKLRNIVGYKIRNIFTHRPLGVDTRGQLKKVRFDSKTDKEIAQLVEGKLAPTPLAQREPQIKSRLSGLIALSLKEVAIEDHQLSRRSKRWRVPNTKLAYAMAAGALGGTSMLLSDSDGYAGLIGIGLVYVCLIGIGWTGRRLRKKQEQEIKQFQEQNPIWERMNRKVEESIQRISDDSGPDS